jgi:hypothetical protein
MDGSEEMARFFESVDPLLIAGIALAVICLVLLISLLLLALGVLAQGGLIAAFSRADDGHDVSLGQAFGLGTTYFWKLIGIRALFWLAGFVIVMVIIAISIPLILATFGLALLLCCCLILPLILIGILVDAYVVTTMVAAVEEEMGVFDSFRRSWELFKVNYVPLGVMAVILIVGSGIINFILVLPFIFAVLPVVIGMSLIAEAEILVAVAVMMLCMLALLPIFLLINAVITTFTTGGWTITYRRLIGREGVEVLGSAGAAA